MKTFKVLEIRDTAIVLKNKERLEELYNAIENEEVFILESPVESKIILGSNIISKIIDGSIILKSEQMEEIK
jgi:hypothetical protein